MTPKKESLDDFERFLAKGDGVSDFFRTFAAELLNVDDVHGNKQEKMNQLYYMNTKANTNNKMRRAVMTLLLAIFTVTAWAQVYYIERSWVTARGGEYAAGIGGGQKANGADVTIRGGIVRAYGGTDAAGIGSGEEAATSTNINGGKLTVYGGYVFADGTDQTPLLLPRGGEC